MTRLSIACAVIVLAACGGSSDKPAKETTPTKTAKMSGGEDTHALCIQLFERQRECTDTFIPALVAARVEVDKPAGIAAKDKEIGRDALVAKAMEEYAVDSTDEAIAATCDKILSEEPGPTQAEIDQGRTCMAADSCQPFVDCVIELVKPRWH